MRTPAASRVLNLITHCSIPVDAIESNENKSVTDPQTSIGAIQLVSFHSIRGRLGGLGLDSSALDEPKSVLRISDIDHIGTRRLEDSKTRSLEDLTTSSSCNGIKE